MLSPSKETTSLSHLNLHQRIESNRNRYLCTDSRTQSHVKHSPSIHTIAKKSEPAMQSTKTNSILSHNEPIDLMLKITKPLAH
jgi:hypothetical protein